MKKLQVQEDEIFGYAMLGRSEQYYARIPLIDVHMLNSERQTILQVALAYRHYEIAIDAIGRGIDVNNQDKNGMTALHYAGERGVLDIAKLLVGRGGDVNLIDKYGNNALWAACLNPKENYDLVQLYKDHGGDAFQKNRAGRSSYDFAVQIKNERLREILADVK